jgi:XRN 5'-3' exonuclease N-terminus
VDRIRRMWSCGPLVRWSVCLPLLLVVGIQCSHAFPLQTRVSRHGPLATSQPTSSALQGISGFRSWFESQFPESVVAINVDSSEETFDHVLLDMNHVIHIVLRRSRSQEHAIRMLLSELDGMLRMAVPTKSLVIALDGAPAAAKLATQRTRRYGTLIKTRWKLDHFDKLRITKRERARKLRSLDAELNSLQITPGTEFQELMENTLFYWAWQRLQHRHSNLSNVKVYISPSTVAGEGEVKLLEWILQKPRRGESVALCGGDSDLLLEGLIIPPYWTHNIFVIQAESARRYFSVSLWETTRNLQSWLPPNAPAEQILQLRTDLVLLMILNGNDYMPKLRGSKGFSKLCQTYQRLVQSEFLRNDMDRNEGSVVGFLDPDTLSFRLDFCIKFFEELARISPKSDDGAWIADAAKREQTPLSKLNNIIQAGFVPGPKRFQCIDGTELRGNTEASATSDNEDDDDADSDEDSDEEETGSSTGKALIKLTLGDPDSGDFIEYELWRNPGEPIKDIKHKLALMALDDFFGANLQTWDEDYEKLMEETGIVSRGYSWEIPHAAPGECNSYLGGLLWNIQTYQDGICADYNFSYGKRMSPGINEILRFFKDADSQGRVLDRHSLLPKKFSPPVSAGLSSLAALPSQVKHLVPEPYRWISDENVEKFYSESMDRESNILDMKCFEALCESEIRRLEIERGVDHTHDDEEHGKDSPSPYGRRILTGQHHWTVFARTLEPLAHPFDPPKPPSDFFAALAPNRRVRVSKTFCIEEPRLRSVWGEKPKGRIHHENEGNDLHHLSFGKLLQEGTRNIFDIPYKVDYAKERQKKSQTVRPVQASGLSPVLNTDDMFDRMEQFQKVMPPMQPSANVEGKTGLTILSEMHALQMIGPVEFSIITPSPSEYASRNPLGYENFLLRITPHRNSQTNVLNYTVSLDQDRDVSRQGKVALKQHLADLALCEILQPECQDWKNISFADIRWTLQQRALGLRKEMAKDSRDVNEKSQSSKKKQIAKSKKPDKKNKEDIELVNQDGQSAMECLKQLVDANLIGPVDISVVSSAQAASLEKMILAIKPSPKKRAALLDKPLYVEEERSQFPRKVTRQRLASRALSELSGGDLDWSAVTFATLRSILVDKAGKQNKKAPTE